MITEHTRVQLKNKREGKVKQDEIICRGFLECMKGLGSIRELHLFGLFLL